VPDRPVAGRALTSPSRLYERAIAVLFRAARSGSRLRAGRDAFLLVGVVVIGRCPDLEVGCGWGRVATPKSQRTESRQESERPRGAKGRASGGVGRGHGATLLALANTAKDDAQLAAKRDEPYIGRRRGPDRNSPAATRRLMYSNAIAPAQATGGSRSRKVTAPELRGRKARLGASAVTMVTAYDFTMARLVDEAGVDVVLVGDSLGMVVQGLPNTLTVTVDDVCYHGRAVARGLERAHLVGDMPFMSYQVSPTQAVESAGKMVQHGAFESVKLEGGDEIAEHVRRIARAGIPVMGHVGLTPQSVHAFGGFKVQGRGDEAARRILESARALEEAGAYAIVLEAIPPDVAASVTREIDIPTIGIGAGRECDGQVLVCTDLLGMSRGPSPRFAKRYVDLAGSAVAAVQAYVAEVQSGAFPGPEHAYKPNASVGAAEVGGEGRAVSSVQVTLRH